MAWHVPRNRMASPTHLPLGIIPISYFRCMICPRDRGRPSMQPAAATATATATATVTLPAAHACHVKRPDRYKCSRFWPSGLDRLLMLTCECSTSYRSRQSTTTTVDKEGRRRGTVSRQAWWHVPCAVVHRMWEGRCERHHRLRCWLSCTGLRTPRDGKGCGWCEREDGLTA